MRPHDQLLRRLRAGLTRAEQRKIEAATAFSCAHLGEIRRRTGEDYAQHGLEIAATLQEATDDASMLCAAILHDILVHPDGAILLKKSPLSEDERKLVRRMHRVRRLHIDERTQDLDTVIDEFVADPRVTLLRMAHRCTDIDHLDRFGRKLQRDLSQETLHMYTSMAGRLSMHAWRHRMEERCFRMLNPSAAKTLDERMAQLSSADDACLTHAKRHLLKAFKAAHISASIDMRRKGLYSCYRKMVLKDRTLHELTDRLALRVIVRSLDECYRALGIVHGVMRPMPGKLKDYIGAPKENGYRSIHTVVFPLPGVSEFPIEVQIRTEEMHRECEFGVSAHGGYKLRSYTLSTPTTRANLFRNLAALRMDSHTPREFAESLRQYFSGDQLLLFDEHGTSWYLQKPASAADFACHTAGERAAYVDGVFVNGRKRPFGTLLTDGDSIMLHFSSKQQKTSGLLHACRHIHDKKFLASLRKAATPAQ